MPIFHGNTIGQGVVLNTPSADGTAGQLITTDGSGNLSFGIAFVTPEQYGAVGDGIADDAPAITAALAAGKQRGTWRSDVQNRKRSFHSCR